MAASFLSAGTGQYPPPAVMLIFLCRQEWQSPSGSGCTDKFQEPFTVSDLPVGASPDCRTADSCRLFIIVHEISLQFRRTVQRKGNDSRYAFLVIRKVLPDIPVDQGRIRYRDNGDPQVHKRKVSFFIHGIVTGKEIQIQLQRPPLKIHADPGTLSVGIFRNQFKKNILHRLKGIGKIPQGIRIAEKLLIPFQYFFSLCR